MNIYYLLAQSVVKFFSIAMFIQGATVCVCKGRSTTNIAVNWAMIPICQLDNKPWRNSKLANDTHSKRYPLHSRLTLGTS